MIDARVPARVTLDDEANAAYIYMVGDLAPSGVTRTVPLDHPGTVINVDFDSDGRALGVETLDAGATLPAELLSRRHSS